MIPTTDLLKVLRDGGILMYPIAFCSLVMLAFVFERLAVLRPRRIIPRAFVTRFLQQVREGELDRAGALALCEENASPVAEVFAGATRKWGRPAVEVEQAVLDAGERATNGLRRHLRVFGAVSTIAPLLGLLGTVFGMIQAFNAVAASDALGRPELLAKGVSQALLTTAFGLTVAIPALLVYYVFVGRVDKLIMEIDALGQELVNLISAEEIQSRSEDSRPAKLRRTVRKEAA
jgi:biopolymer transport protein ExbB